MTKIRFTLLLTLIALALTATPDLSAQTRSGLKNDCTIELGGRCVVYGFTYQRLLKPNLGLEFGASILGGTGDSIAFLSGGGRFYLSSRRSSPFLSGGLVVVTSATDSGPFTNSDSTFYAYLTPGFEYRSTGGFLFRAGLNILINNGVFFWPGVAFGIQF